MEYKSKKSRKARVMRFLGRAVPAILAAGVLAACGGGGGGGGNDEIPAPKACESTQPTSESGYAVGTCESTGVTVLRGIDSQVSVSNAGYNLTIQPTGEVQQVVRDFTATNLSPVIVGGDGVLRYRTILGGLSGVAYEESPNLIDREIRPPFVAVIDFHDAWTWSSSTVRGAQVLGLTSVSFGTWDRAITDGEGYFGVWYAQRPNASDTTRPNTQTHFAGRAVGILGATTNTSFSRLSLPLSVDPFFAQGGTARGYSADVEVTSSGQTLSGTLSALVVSVANEAGEIIKTASFDLEPISILSTNVPPSGVITGTLSSSEIEAGTGTFEATFFGLPGNAASKEIGGRFQFRTTDGLVAIGSFGAHQ